jgi:phenylpyruvate tautomerase PptA (4-oxalocrotonate tautomerase family)
MPIIKLEIVLYPQEELDEALAQKLANALGQIFGTGPNETWVMVRPVEANHYAENDETQRYYPVFASVLKGAWPERALLEKEANQLNQVIGELCHRPQAHVHILYETPASGRIAFGGQITWK